MADIPNFANNEYERKEQERKRILASTNVTYHNNKAMKKLGRTRLILTGLGIAAIIGVLGYSAWESHQYEYVLFPGDTYNQSYEGGVQHAAKPDILNFIQAYKLVNEKATGENIINAICKGQYQDYVDHNGRVKIDKDLQGEPLPNSQVIEFSEDFLEQYQGKTHK